MCRFFSFVTTKDGRFLCGDTISHGGIERGWGLKPGSYREAEWLSERPEDLIVRGVGKSDSNWFKAEVLAKFSCRSELLASITVGKTDLAKFWYLNGQLHRRDGPAIELVSGTREWWLYGQRHREDGPAIEVFDGTKYWYLDYLLQKVEFPDGTTHLYRDSKPYKVVFPDGTEHRYTDT